MVKIIETQVSIDQDELFRLRTLPAQEQQEPATQGQMARLEARQATLNRLRHGFTRQPDELVSAELKRAAAGSI